MEMNKFEKAFHGKRFELLHRLVVDLYLLNCLHDKGMLTDLQLEPLKVLKVNSEKVHELLGILCRLEDAKFVVFCSVLHIVGQSAIVKMIRPDAEPTQPRPDESQHSTEQGNDIIIN